jgi:hypothetical protein
MAPRKTRPDPPGRNGFRYRQQYGVIVVCAHERDQAKTYSRLRRLGYACKVVTV